MVTIHNLEVRFEVEGDEDEMAFAQLFNKYIQQWNRLNMEQQALQRRADRDRALGDRPDGAYF